MSMWCLGTAVELKLGAFEILSALVSEKPNSQILLFFFIMGVGRYSEEIQFQQ